MRNVKKARRLACLLFSVHRAEVYFVFPAKSLHPVAPFLDCDFRLQEPRRIKVLSAAGHEKSKDYERQGQTQQDSGQSPTEFTATRVCIGNVHGLTPVHLSVKQSATGCR
jgi:hypothetical protein